MTNSVGRPSEQSFVVNLLIMPLSATRAPFSTFLHPKQLLERGHTYSSGMKILIAPAEILSWKDEDNCRKIVRFFRRTNRIMAYIELMPLVIGLKIMEIVCPT